MARIACVRNDAQVTKESRRSDEADRREVVVQHFQPRVGPGIRGYDRSINNSAEYFNFLQDAQSCLCPKCGDDGHLARVQRGTSGSPRKPAPSDGASREAGNLDEFTARKPRFSLENDVIFSATSQGKNWIPVLDDIRNFLLSPSVSFLAGLQPLREPDSATRLGRALP